MRVRLLVDAMNVIGSRPDGWWHDRDGAVRRLAADLVALTAEAAVTLVCDGRAVAGLPAGDSSGITVCYAGSGRNAADDLLVEMLRATRREGPGSAEVVVVTADRDLRARAQQLGAKVEGPTWLRRRLEP